MKSLLIFLYLICSLILTNTTSAQSRGNATYFSSDPRGPAEITVCSQNLENFGFYNKVKERLRISEEQFNEKISAIAKRINQAKCDVIAVQEVFAKNEIESQQVLEYLAKEINKKNGRFYEIATGPSNDKYLRLGFLVAKDRAKIENTTSYWKVELPKLSPNEKPKLFSRSPLEIQISVNGKEGSVAKSVVLVNFHLKSKHGAAGDPAQLEWEGQRMQMAEAIRVIVQNRHARSFASSENILLLMGDRNSNFDAASAEILNGKLSLNRFQGEAICRLSKRGVPLCKRNAYIPQKLFSVLTEDPQTKNIKGTFVYKKVYSWLDEIIMPAESLIYAWDSSTSTGDYNSGVIWEHPEASDHAMVWVRLNW